MYTFTSIDIIRFHRLIDSMVSTRSFPFLWRVATQDHNLQTILVVDVLDLIAMSEKIQQEAEGYHVILANSVANAVRMVCTENLPVELIMVDVDLGAGSDEIEAAR